MKELFQTIHAVFIAEPHHDFFNLCSGGLHYDSAPQGTAYPYAVIKPVTALNADTFSARIDRALIQLDVYSTESSSAQCWDICRAAEDFMTRNTFQPSGHADVKFIRNLMLLPLRGGGKLWEAHGDFRALVQRDKE